MSLNLLEKTIIKQFLADKGASVTDENSFFSDLKVESREFSGVGFITNLTQSEKLKVDPCNKSYKWGSLGATLNHSIDTGYLLYVEDGYLIAIEGYTYAEDWPKEISQVETYTV